MMAKIRFGNIEELLRYLNHRYGSSGEFAYPGLDLSEFNGDMEMTIMVEEVAKAMADEVIKKAPCLRKNLFNKQKDLAAIMITCGILGKDPTLEFVEA